SLVKIANIGRRRTEDKLRGQAKRQEGSCPCRVGSMRDVGIPNRPHTYDASLLRRGMEGMMKACTKDAL
ncbi:UNVERIFIED_CONTAM: hypothetical protein Sindi_1721000, partial [Sesamum indicum]